MTRIKIIRITKTNRVTSIGVTNQGRVGPTKMIPDAGIMTPGGIVLSTMTIVARIE